MWDAKLALLVVARRLAAETGGNADDALRHVFVPNPHEPDSIEKLVLQWGDNDDQDRYTFQNQCVDFTDACSPTKTWDKTDGHYDVVIAFNVDYYSGLQFSTLVTHELGHAFGKLWGGTSYDETGGIAGDWRTSANRILIGKPAPSTYRHASSSHPTEMFADMFTAWAYSSWNRDTSNALPVHNASIEMSTNMSEWIP